MRYRVNLHVMMTSFIILVILLSPFTVNQVFDLKSLVPGIALGQFVGLLALSHKLTLPRSVSRTGFGLFSVFAAMLFINAIVSETPFFPVVVLLVLLVLIALNCQLFSLHLAANPDDTRRAILLSYFVVVALGLMNFITPTKHIPLIGEPSYFALVVGPLALFSYAFNRRIGLFNIAVLFSMGVVLPNVTILLFGALNLIWITVRRSILLLSVSVIAIVAIPVAIQFVLETPYFAARLTFDVQSANLSNLLFLINWGDAVDRVLTFRIFGQGLGSVGSILTPDTDAAERAMELYGGLELTFSSGTFWFARSMQTMGYAALFVIAVYIWRFVRLLRAFSRNSQALELRLAVACYSAMLPELFFRSAGLIGPLMIWFFAAMAFEKLYRNSFHYQHDDAKRTAHIESAVLSSRKDGEPKY